MMVRRERLVKSRFKPMQKMLYFSSLSSYVVSLMFGFSIGYSSTVLPQLLKDQYVDSTGASWFGSLVNIGAILGCPLAGFFLDRSGRRSTLLLSALPFAIGYFLIAQAELIIESLYLGRLLTGVGAGMASVCAPMYISEISTPDKRGTLGSGVQLAITTGILLAYVCGAYTSWYWLAWLGVAIPLSGTVLSLLSPESPRYFILRGRRQEALLSLRVLRGPYADIDDELRDIEESIDVESVSWSEFTKPELKRPLQVGVGIFILQQLSGINVIMFYTVSIFESAGLTKLAAQATVLLGAVQVACTLVACVLMDRAGRRLLLFIAGLGMCGCTLILSFYYYVKSQDETLAQSMVPLAIGSLLVYMVAFSLGWGPVPGLVMSEIFPIRARARAGALTALAGWTSSFVITKLFSDFAAPMDICRTFAIFCACCLVGVVFVYRKLPETKGRRLEDIELYFLGAATHTL